VDTPSGFSGSSYLRIVAHYEEALARHGDSHRGVDWPNLADAEIRYRVMLDLLSADATRREARLELLDFGCGAGHFLEFLRREDVTGIADRGIDLSDRFIALCHEKFAGVPFSCVDVLAPETSLPECDYVIANGVFTEKCDLSFEEMTAFFEAVVRRLWTATRRGMAFNLMSTNVEWEREDLFHMPLDVVTAFLTRHITRHLVIRMDYALHEYTVYAYRQPSK
jgi:SAM-dependent methyltransferase